ncbi:hypothetical protein GO986_08490 [Deinococcus sp. HMF7620]|uniref:Uncharacterized protein n=1 Tax=Deinococcus arboris TaxID=2682977 RepID=A0A7C9M8C3_9DEIO|nr:hypothetical protein [Deinococcus arboris]MVN86799.1 hypothetical protein [Deinococcus arboris]
MIRTVVLLKTGVFLSGVRVEDRSLLWLVDWEGLRLNRILALRDVLMRVRGWDEPYASELAIARQDVLALLPWKAERA